MTVAGTRRAVDRLLEFGPGQVAAYELTIEPGTPLAAWAGQFPGAVPSPEQVVAQQRSVERRLAAAGLYRYEVCSYARPGLECRHNLPGERYVPDSLRFEIGGTPESALDLS